MALHRLLLTCLICGLLVLPGCGQTTALSKLNQEGTGQVGETAGADSGEGADLGELYVLDSNDTLGVTVFNHEDLSGEFLIGTEGKIAMPLIGEVDAAGKTLRTLSQDIEGRFRDGYLRNPQVSVQVVRYRPFYIFGSVDQPGDYEYQSNMNVLSAIAIAGGYAENALEGSNVMVIRSTDRSRTPVEVELTAPIYPGDIVEVPREGAGPVPGR